MRMRVMTYNIRYGLGSDGRLSLHRVHETIALAAPSLVALQEVDYLVRRSGLVAQPAWLGHALNMYWVFGPNVFWNWPAAYGNAVLSDRPVMEAVNYALPGGRERRGLLVVRRADLTLACTHLGLDAGERAEQVAAVIRILRPLASRPLILAGDFNCRRDDPELEELHNFLRDTAPDARLYTYPAANPTVKTDYVFVSSHFITRNVSTPVSTASDHLPLCADISLVTLQGT